MFERLIAEALRADYERQIAKANDFAQYLPHRDSVLRTLSTKLRRRAATAHDDRGTTVVIEPVLQPGDLPTVT